MYTISDPVFGKLERHGQSWQGSVYLEFLERKVDLTFDYADVNEDTQSEVAQAAFSSFVQDQEKLFPAIEKAVFHYCELNLQLYRSHYEPDEQDIYVQAIKNPKEIWQLLEITHIHLAFDHQSRITISIICNFSWDQEHGLDIDLFNNQIGIAEGGAHWLDKSHFDLEGKLIQASRPEEQIPRTLRSKK